MPDRTQDLKNHRQVAVACKNYTDSEIKKSEGRILSIVARNNVNYIDHIDEASYKITAPANAKLLMLQSIGGNTVKLSPSVASDSTKAMIKTMPSTVYTFDGSKYYGDSLKSENLAVLTDTAQTTDRGITYSISNGTINVGDSANANLTITLSSLTYFNGTYTFKNFGSQALSNNAYFVFLLNGEWTTVVTIKSDSGTITLNGNYVYGIAITSGTSVSGTIKPMLVEGSTAPTTFKQGFIGIHNIELTGLKVEGENLAPTPTYNGIMNNTIARTLDLGNLPYGTYTLSFNVSANSGDRMFIIYFANNGVIDLQTAIFTNLKGTGAKSYTFTLDNSITYDDVRLGINTQSQDFTITLDSLMLNRGSTPPTSYVPYIQPTTISVDLTSIEDSGGNKLFADGSLKGVGNVVDEITPYKAIKRIDEVLGSTYENAITTATTSAGLTCVVIQTNITFVDSDTTPLVEINNLGLTTLSASSQWATTLKNVIAFNRSKRIIITFDQELTEQQMIDKAKTLMVNFALLTPIEVSIDWSATLRNIQGYPNGSIIAENTHNMDVESVITYNSIIQETLCPSVTVNSMNAWDEEWEVGGYNDSTGAKTGDNSKIRAKNYNSCLPSTTYYGIAYGETGGGIYINILFYDKDKNFISKTIIGGSTVTTPSNAYYFTFYMQNAYGTTYKNNICINVSNANLNGTYKPYKNDTRNLPTQASDGWSAGTQRNYRVFCDDEGNEVSKRYTNIAKENNLQSVNFVGANGFFQNSFSRAKQPANNTTTATWLLSRIYEPDSASNVFSNAHDKRVALNPDNNYIQIRDNSYSDKDTFNLAMTNEPLYFELKDSLKTETDMDDFDYFFDVEEGDVITFNNPYAQQVYATYSFLIKEAKSNE